MIFLAYISFSRSFLPFPLVKNGCSSSFHFPPPPSAHLLPLNEMKSERKSKKISNREEIKENNMALAARRLRCKAKGRWRVPQSPKCTRFGVIACRSLFSPFHICRCLLHWHESMMLKELLMSTIRIVRWRREAKAFVVAIRVMSRNNHET